MSTRPPSLLSAADVPEEEGRYDGLDERFSIGRALGRRAGMQKLGLHLERLPPGRRTSLPHAESSEEEFVFVLDGEVDAWLDGVRHRMRKHDFLALPSGTGVAHTIQNNGTEEALLFVGGEATKPINRITYPRDPERKARLGAELWWHDAPTHPQGPDAPTADAPTADVPVEDAPDRR